jgi:hypothetical protein
MGNLIDLGDYGGPADIKTDWIGANRPTRGGGPRQETQITLDAFEAYFSNGGNISKTCAATGLARRTVQRYEVWYEWKSRLILRRQKARELMESKAAESVATMLDKHYQVGNRLIDRAVEFLENMPIDNARDAINAAKLGIEIQRKVRELPDWIHQVQNATPEQIVARVREIQRTLARAGTPGIDEGVGGEGDRTEFIDAEFRSETDSGEGLLSLPEEPDSFCEGRTELLPLEQAARDPECVEGPFTDFD